MDSHLSPKPRRASRANSRFFPPAKITVQTARVEARARGQTATRRKHATRTGGDAVPSRVSPARSPEFGGGDAASEPLRTRAEDRVRGNVGWHKRIARRVVVAAEGGYALARDARDARGDARGGPCRVTARAPGVRPEEARVAGARARQGRRHRRALRAAGCHARASSRGGASRGVARARLLHARLLHGHRRCRTNAQAHPARVAPASGRRSAGDPAERRRERKRRPRGRLGVARRRRRRTRSRFRRAFFWVRPRARRGASAPRVRGAGVARAPGDGGAPRARRARRDVSPRRERARGGARVVRD